MRRARECGEHVPLFFLLRAAKFFAVCDAGWQDFLLSATWGGKIFYFLLLHTRVQLRAARMAFMPLLGTPQEGAEEGRPDGPSGTPLAADAG